MYFPAAPAAGRQPDGSPKGSATSYFGSWTLFPASFCIASEEDEVEFVTKRRRSVTSGTVWMVNI
jgi:hypothetical protein